MKYVFVLLTALLAVSQADVSQPMNSSNVERNLPPTGKCTPLLGTYAITGDNDIFYPWGQFLTPYMLPPLYAIPVANSRTFQVTIGHDGDNCDTWSWMIDPMMDSWESSFWERQYWFENDLCVWYESDEDECREYFHYNNLAETSDHYLHWSYDDDDTPKGNLFWHGTWYFHDNGDEINSYNSEENCYYDYCEYEHWVDYIFRFPNFDSGTRGIVWRHEFFGVYNYDDDDYEIYYDVDSSFGATIEKLDPRADIWDYADNFGRNNVPRSEKNISPKQKNHTAEEFSVIRNERKLTRESKQKGESKRMKLSKFVEERKRSKSLEKNPKP